MQSDLIKSYKSQLNTTFQKADDNEDVRKFFTYLYQYMELLHKKKELKDVLVAEINKLEENLNPEDKAKVANAEVKEPVKTFTSWRKNVRFMRLIYDEKRLSNVYFCYLRLNFYYNIYEELIDNVRDEFSDDTNVKRAMRLLNKEFKNIFRYNSDEKNTLTKMPQYKLALEMFHPWFVSRLEEQDSSEVQVDESTTTLVKVKSPKNIKVEPRSYDSANGTLTLAGHKVQIIGQPNKKGALHESKQAKLMRLVFKDVNTMRDGVPMRKIVSVTAPNLSPEKRKLVINYITEINNKISDELAINDLIQPTQLAVIINERYL